MSKLDDRVGKLIAIDRTWREVLFQNRGTFLDRADQAVGRLPARKCGCQHRNHIIPDIATHFLINAGVGENLGVAFGNRYKDQHAGAQLCVLKPMRRELSQRLLMGAFALGSRRHDAVADAFTRETVEHTEKTREL